jgi:hypothetical protein
VHGIGHNRYAVGEPAADKFDNCEDEIQPESPTDAVFGDIMVMMVPGVMLVTVVMSVRMLGLTMPVAVFAHRENSAKGLNFNKLTA